MTLHGHIENGAIVLDTALSLPDGAQVRVEVVGQAIANKTSESQRERLKQLRDKVSALPVQNPLSGFSNRDHDDILYGDISHGEPS